MGNRHAHKKLRRAVRERMARTGESYQTARTRLLKQSAPIFAGLHAKQSAFDLLAVTIHGRRSVIAIVLLGERLAVLSVPGSLGDTRISRSPLAAFRQPPCLN